MDESNKRDQIKIIKSDTTLTEKEKSIKIQQLMSNNYINKIQSESNTSNTCSHYQKKCFKFKFSCCDIIDPCKRCHIERGLCKLENIKVLEITCIECGMTQKPNLHNECESCGIKFANSYCAQCQIWTQKQITHCIECGICRIGTKETLFHCIDCGICFNKLDLVEQTQIHQCIGKKYTYGICVICAESTFTSQSESIHLPCNHFIHRECFDKYIEQNKYNCPHCKKSICDMTSQWNFIRSKIKLHPIPNDMISIEQFDIVDTQFGKFIVNSIEIINGIKLFNGKFINWFRDKNQTICVSGTLNNSMVKKNIYKQIHCNDCIKKSTSLFHFYGLECNNCGSFNTQE